MKKENKFEVGDKVIYKSTNSRFIHFNAVGTVLKIEDFYVWCEDWSKYELNHPDNVRFGITKPQSWASKDEIELATSYLQQQEAKKLLGIK